MTLFPMETEQYDSWLMRELLNNCIAHTNYQLGGRIYVNEFRISLNLPIRVILFLENLIVEYLKQYRKAKKKDIREPLRDKLPDVLSNAQKENKIRNMLTALRKQDIIDTDSENQQKSNLAIF